MDEFHISKFEMDNLKFPVKGTMGTIYKVKKKGSPTHCYLKRIAIPPDETEKQETLEKVLAICKLDHKNIVKCMTDTRREGPQGNI